MTRFAKTSLLVWILIDALALAVFFWLAFSTSDTDARLEEKSRQAEIMLRREEEVSVLEKAAEETAGDRARLNSFFVDSRDVTGFLNALEDLGKKTGAELEMQAINVLPGPPASLKANFKAEGSFADLYRLTQFIEQVPYELKINKVLLSASEAGWNGDFEVELLSFVFNPSK